MSKPVIADNKPSKVMLKKGQTYLYCTCGLSNKQPFCDGSHSTTEFRPQLFTAEKDGDGFLCMCKRSANAPYCDGSHGQIDDSQIGNT